LPGDFGIGGALADFDSDGDLDLIVGNYSNVKLYVNENGYFSYRNTLSTGSWHVAVGDLNKDGFIDLVTAYGGGAVTSFLNDGQGNFQIKQSFGQGTPFRLYLADFNSDGNLDLLQGNYWGTKPVIYFGHGDGTFSLSQIFPDDNSLAAAIADFDGDGDYDIAFARWPGRPDKVYFNDGSGYFVDSGQNLLDSLSTYDIAAADLDNDGDIDLIAGQDEYGTEPNKIWLNNGQGYFTLSSVGLGHYYTHVIKVADIDKDGDVDVLEGNTGGLVGFDSREKLYLNNGLGNSFTEITITERRTRTNELLLGDINGDSLLDLVDITWWDQSGNGTPDSIYIYLNTNQSVAEEKPSLLSNFIQIYPNPFSRILTVNCPTDFQMNIYDISGRVVKTIESQGKVEWRPNGLSAGTYFIKIKIGDNEQIQKVIYLK
jgi:hypothetical protein